MFTFPRDTCALFPVVPTESHHMPTKRQAVLMLIISAAVVSLHDLIRLNAKRRLSASAAGTEKSNPVLDAAAEAAINV